MPTIKDAQIILYGNLEDINPENSKTILKKAGFKILDWETDPNTLDHTKVIGICAGYEKLDSATLNRYPNLKVISLCSRGRSTVDTHYTQEKKIQVLTIHASGILETAEHTLSLILAGSKYLKPYSQESQLQNWFERTHQIPLLLRESTLGIIGSGSIAHKVKEISQALFKEVIHHSPTNRSMDHQVSLSLKEVISQSDIITINTALTSATRHLVDKEVLQHMKPHSILVNTSRGAIIKEDNLLEALKQNIISFACLDVLEDEPPKRDNALLNHPKILITPHIAYMSEHSLREYALEQSQNMLNALTKERSK